MRRILFSIFLVQTSIGTIGQTLSIAPLEAEVETQTELVVNANGVSSMTALQFNLELPEGVSLADVDSTMGEATDGHTLCVETLDNGDLLFILYSMNLNRFKDGEVLRIPININGEGTARLYNVRFADTDAVSYAGKETATGISLTPSPSPRRGEIYNIAGQRLSKMLRGINIINGRKVVIK